MKHTIINASILLLGLHSLIACNFKQDIPTTLVEEYDDRTNNNTIVHYKCIANTIDRKCYEYFIVENGDTSTYSFKSRNFTYSNEFCVTVSNLIHNGTGKYKVKGVDGIMNELDSCLNSIAIHNDIDSLKFLELPIGIMGDVAVEFNKALYSKGFREIDYQQHPEILLSAIHTTSLNNRVDFVLKRHGLHIKEITIGWGLPTSREHFLKHNIVCDSNLVPQQLTLAYVRYRCEPV